MSRINTSLHGFNRGLISPLALARTDLERTGLSAETFTNWMPRNLGSMMLCPGRKYIGATRSNLAAKYIPFVFSTTDTALCELTATTLRVWISDVLISRTAVSSAVTNGTFTSNVTSWTDNDEAGGVSVWVTGGYLGLTGNGTAAAIREQEITVAAGDQSVEHALDIVIQRGPVTLRVGSTTGDDDYISETTLDTGSHSLALTPTGNFFIEFSSRLKRQVLVDSCDVAASGTMTVTAPWAEADLSKVRFDQSGDILFIAADGYQQYKIERRSSTSWSVVKYEPEDGPFRTINTGPITIAASAISGNVTLTASAALFKSTNVGGLYRITSTGQTVTASVTTDNTFTNTIRVTGVTTSRIFTITRAGIWSGTVTLQRSLDSATGPWEDVATYTTNATISFDDTLDNQIAWYQIGVKTGEFTANVITGATQANPCVITVTDTDIFSTGEVIDIAGVVGMTELNGTSPTVTKVTGTTYQLDGVDSTGYGAYGSAGTATSAGPVTLTLDYPIGAVDGIARITDYTTALSVGAEVIVDLGGTAASDDWYEGEWSSRRGFPTSVAFVEGRLSWAGRDKVWFSVSDGFSSFDDSVVGDSAPFTRTIGSGPVDNVNWLIAARRLILGTDGAELTCRSSSEDEPLTSSNASIKPFSTQGSAPVAAVKLDTSGIYAQRGGTRVMEAAFGDNFEYQSNDLTTFYPEAGDSPITHIAVQRQPDTRVHCVRTDGDVSILLHDKAENVSCWVKVESRGDVEDVVVLPGASGDGEDAVYYVTKRTVNSATVRYLEKWALESQCQGGSINRQSDSHITYSGSAVTTITGLTHQEGETVTVWGNGKDLGTKVVSNGQITGISEAVTNACVGLGYTGQWKSAKLAYASGLGTALSQKKKIPTLGVILSNTHYQGIQYGPDFTNMDNLPLVKDGTVTAADTIHTSFDEETFSFPGEWDTDSRLCLQAASPRPCTVLAAVIAVETHDRY